MTLTYSELNIIPDILLLDTQEQRGSIHVLIRRKCSESIFRHLEDILSQHTYKKCYNNSDTLGSTNIAVTWDVVFTETSSKIQQNFGVYDVYYILKSQCNCEGKNHTTSGGGSDPLQVRYYLWISYI